MRHLSYLFVLTGLLCTMSGEPEYGFPVTQLSLNDITSCVRSGEYSGITHISGSHYAVVHDKLGGGGLLFFNIHFREDGSVSYIFKTKPKGTSSSGGADNEGVAYFPPARTLFVSAEADQSIREYDLKGRPTGRCLEIPADMSVGDISPNKGFEALSYNRNTHLFWTVTEGPLLRDAASPELLRLQSFGDDLRPAERYLYRMDTPAAMPEQAVHALAYVHGVSALTALDDGRLIVLEREVYVPSGSLKEKLSDSFTVTKLYVVNPACDTAHVLRKSLLHTFTTTALSSFANYEGMCLGPVLPDGRQTLLMIPDSQNGSGGLTREYLLVLSLAP